MLPGIIPVGVTVPTFSYKEGYTGSMASGNTETITMTTPASQYRWIVISAAFGQSSTNSTYIINIEVNGAAQTEIYAATSGDKSGTGSCSTSHLPIRITTGSSFTLKLLNNGNFSMNYTVAVFEIPTGAMQVVANNADYGTNDFSFSGPQYFGGLVIASQFAQGGTGSWATMAYQGATKVPVASAVQESLAYVYPTTNGTFDVVASNSGTYNRICAISTWAPV